MDKALKKTIYGLFIISIILFLIGFGIFTIFFAEYYYWFFPVLILFFFLVNSAFFVFFHKSLRKSHNQFIRNFMISTGLKLMIYFILILAYVLTSPKTSVAFAITLSVVYIVYTTYDLLVMLSLLKRNKENQNLTDKLSN